jgi:large subunit ribosomal protein L15
MLGQLKPSKGSVKTAKRVGRGLGSGTGKTAGRGSKGQRSRSGGKTGRRGFEGGQMPLQRRLPKRGFNNVKFAKVTGAVTTRQLNQFDDGATVGLAEVKKAGFIKRESETFKVIFKGDVEKKLTVVTKRLSEKAKEAIEAKGGTVDNS